MFELDLHRLTVFYTVVNEGTLSKAGDRLFMSQPAISAHIKALEQQMGMPLFSRVGRRSVVNKAGEVLYQKTQELFSVADELKAAMENLKGISVGRLSLGASTDWQYRLPLSLERFRQSFPSVEVTLEVGNSDRIEKLVLDRAVDMGFVAKAPSRPDIECVRLGEDYITPICNPTHALASCEAITPDQLRGESFIVRELGSAARKVTDELLCAWELKPRISMELGSYEAIKRSVMAGKGIGIVSAQSARFEVGAGMLSQVDAPALKKRFDLFLIFLREKKMPSNHEAFMEIVWPRESSHEHAAD
jgi:DNA-binding transcriptional LysR family regulator